jgi:hypothetical protein
MTIRSIDMQILIPKVTDVAKVQQIQQQEHNIRQQENANHIARETTRNTNTVNQPLRDEAALVHEKEEEKHKKNKEKKGKNQNVTNTKNSVENSVEKSVDNPGLKSSCGNTIDIKV